MDEKNDNLPSELEPKLSISEAVLDVDKGVLNVRGWRLCQGDQVKVVLMSDRLGEIGEAEQGIVREDVSKKFPQYSDSAPGWSFRAVVGEWGPEENITAVLKDSNGELSLSKSPKLMYTEQGPGRFSISECYYDTESKFLHLAGEVYPKQPPYRLRVVLGNGRTEVVQSLFLPSGNKLLKTGGLINQFGGFKTKVLFLGQGSLTSISLVADLIDGAQSVWDIDPRQVLFDRPDAAISLIRLDMLRDRLLVEGWYRSYDPVTTVELTLGNQKCFAYPVIEKDPELTKELGFRGPSVFRVRYDAVLSEALDIKDLKIADASATLSLFNRNSLLGGFQSEPDMVEIVSTRATKIIFDKRRSLLLIWGQCAPGMHPKEVVLSVNGRVVGEPLMPVCPDADPSAEIFTWFVAKEINFDLKKEHRIGLEAFGHKNTGGEKIRGVPEPIIVSASQVVDSHEDHEVGALISAHNLAPRRFPEPTVTFVFQGSVLSKGGGVTRLLTMLRAFKEAGYYTSVIDRTAPWEYMAAIDEYTKFRTICDEHMVVPQVYKRHILEDALVWATSGRADSPESKKLTENLRRTQKEGRLTKGDGKGLYSRVDSQFNLICAAIAHRHRPDLLISLFAWSCEVHNFLPSNTYGMIDTIDVQSSRYMAFQAAQEKYGSTAIPSLAKYTVDAKTERSFLNTAQTCIAISLDEKELLDEMIGAHRTVLASVAGQESAFVGSPSKSKSVLFVGNNYEPNNHGIREFVDNVWPAILAKVPQATLNVVGSCGQSIEGLGGGSITVHGVVHDLEPFYSDAAVVTNPVYFGTGVPVKVVEALSKGKACVATAVGARGMEAASGAKGALAISETSDGLSSTIVELLSNPKKRSKMEHNAYEYARVHLAPGAVHSNLFNYLESKMFY
jgi:glycosyltransferase involved in cell wall biosynthesis